MTPYWTSSDGRLVIYHGRAEDVLPTLPSESVDLMVTDPPYGVDWQSGRRTESFALIAGDHDQTTALGGLALALRVVRRHRHLYIFGRFDLSPLPICEPVELIWDKVNKNAGDLSIPWGNQHEYIQFAVVLKSKSQQVRGDGRLAARLRKGSVLRYLRPNADAVTRHPTEKPVGLLRELIESSSCIDETVLDPFMGSGSTGEACKREDRRFIGIEIEEAYCEIAARRLEDPPMLAALKAEQGDLFTEAG